MDNRIGLGVSGFPQGTAGDESNEYVEPVPSKVLDELGKTHHAHFQVCMRLKGWLDWLLVLGANQCFMGYWCFVGVSKGLRLLHRETAR